MREIIRTKSLDGKVFAIVHACFNESISVTHARSLVINVNGNECCFFIEERRLIVHTATKRMLSTSEFELFSKCIWNSWKLDSFLR